MDVQLFFGSVLLFCMVSFAIGLTFHALSPRTLALSRLKEIEQEKGIGSAEYSAALMDFWNRFGE